MARSTERKAAVVFAGLLMFAVVLAIVPNAIPALDALRRFVGTPVVSILIVGMVFGKLPASWQATKQGDG